jgi:cytochrome c2
MIFNTFLKRTFLLLTILGFSIATFAQAADINAGKDLFRNNCAACHNKDMKSKMTGPPLGGVQERWAEFPEEDLYTWIRNSQAMVDAGHPRAVEVYEEYNKVAMLSYPGFSDEDIKNVLAYVDEVYNAVPEVVEITSSTSEGGSGRSNTWLYLILGSVLVVVALVLMRVIANLNYLVKIKEGDTNAAKPEALLKTLTGKSVIAFAVFALFIFVSNTMVNQAVMLGRQIGYAPEQPIKFSHKTHAGDQQIDCKFCHDGARRSKHSVIPSGNTCMLCHKAVMTGSQYGTAELTKIFASVGFDPTANAYIENYDEMSKEDIEKIFKKWIKDQELGFGSSDAKAENEAKKQWKGIVEALTSPENGDNKIQGPIEWVKIHNLPDHVYYNHAQHVTVGELECQTCHGPVEEMDVVRQQAPLSMGWCINCHRQTEVQFEGNDYYNSYTKYHDELSKGSRDKVTVEDIGGLDCQKCHY